MANDDFPMPVKVRMWAYMAANSVGCRHERLDYAEDIAQFLWADFEMVSDYPAKEDIN